MRPKFWELPLADLTVDEWEALCDGCGRCCLKKFTDEDDEDDVIWTRVVCRYFDESTNQCGCYSSRNEKVPDCVDVKTLDLLATRWIPNTCAYKLRAQELPLFHWHPLLAGSTEAIADADISISGKVVSEENVHPQGYYEHVIRWVGST
jgi:uncharacterized cysteine cluster protein YcgN (CxxCxxCC family)